jgi:Anti-sigma-K factor rskA
VVALVLIGILLWSGGLLTGGDDDEQQASSQNASQPQQGDAQKGAATAQTQGQAIIAEQDGKTQLVVTATGLDPSTERTAYQVWLYNSPEDRRSLGATVTDQQGSLQSGTQLPAGYRKYRFIDVSSVSLQGGGRQDFKAGLSVLRGLLELRDRPVTRGTGNQRITLQADIRLLPLPQSGG